MTVVERFIIEGDGRDQDGEVKIGQRVYYRGKFLGKVRFHRGL